jgi:hypothetical protein
MRYVAVALGLLCSCDERHGAPAATAAAASASASAALALPPAQSGTPRVTLQGSDVLVDGQVASRLGPDGAPASRGLRAALGAASAGGATIVEVALADDAPMAQWSAIAKAAQHAQLERLAFVVPGEAIDVELDTATIRARHALQLVHAKDKVELTRWSYQERVGEPVVVDAAGAAAARACQGGEAPCAERVIVRVAGAPNVRELVATIAVAKRVAALAGAYEPPILALGKVDDKSPLWAYRTVAPALTEILFKSQARAFDACFEAARAAEPALGETFMTTRFAVDPDGTVRDVKNEPVERRDAPHIIELHGCVAQAIAAITFPLVEKRLTLAQTVVLGR